MDPNTALENILRGYLIGDHAEALAGWLASEGFPPHVRTLSPDDRARFVLQHCAKHYPHADLATISVRADRHGLWTATPETPWISMAIWPDLLRIND